MQRAETIEKMSKNRRKERKKARKHTHNWFDLVRFVYGHNCTIDIEQWNAEKPAEMKNWSELRRLHTMNSLVSIEAATYKLLNSNAMRPTVRQLLLSQPVSQSVTQSWCHLQFLQLNWLRYSVLLSLSLSFNAHFVFFDGPKKKDSANFDLEKTRIER